jgi:VanZ family protein
MPKRIKKLLERNAFVIAISTTILVAYLSLSSSGVGITLPYKNIDKVFHFTAYFVLTTTWLFAFRDKNVKFKIALALTLYGIILEFAQEWFTDNRTKDVYDALANTFGIIIAIILFKYIYNNFVKKIWLN